MQAVNFVNIIALACAIAAAITVGRTALLKQTISAQAELITTLKDKNVEHESQIAQQDRRIEILEAIIHANPGMVGSGHLASCTGCGCRNSPTSAKSPKNRGP